MAFPAGQGLKGAVELVEVPSGWPMSALQDVDFQSSMKFRSVSPGQRRGLTVEAIPASHETVRRELGEASRVTKWMPRGTGTAPVSTTAPVILISQRVPDGSRFWMESFSFALSPTARENIYYWQILVNGIDLLNYGSVTRFPGRPIIWEEAVSLGMTRDQQPCAGPGSLIQVVVMAVSIPAILTDTITACLIGSLEGVRP